MKKSFFIMLLSLCSFSAFGQVDTSNDFFKPTYYDNGNIHRTARFISSMNKIIQTTFYQEKSNLIRTIFIYDSMYCPVDSACAFYKNGQLSFKLHRNENNFPHGDYNTYYENGQIKTSGHYYNGFLTGKWLRFYPNGDTCEYGSYCLTKLDSLTTAIDATNICYDTLFIYSPDTYPVYDYDYDELYFRAIYLRRCPKKEGMWLYYDKVGILIKKEEYKDGVLIE